MSCDTGRQVCCILYTFDSFPARLQIGKMLLILYSCIVLIDQCVSNVHTFKQIFENCCSLAFISNRLMLLPCHIMFVFNVLIFFQCCSFLFLCKNQLLIDLPMFMIQKQFWSHVSINCVTFLHCRFSITEKSNFSVVQKFQNFANSFCFFKI